MGEPENGTTVCHCMHMNHGILGIRRRNQPVYPREKIGLGTEEKKVKEIPKEMKYFGYRVDEIFWVQRE